MLQLDDIKVGVLVGTDKYGNRYYENKNETVLGNTFFYYYVMFNLLLYLAHRQRQMGGFVKQVDTTGSFIYSTRMACVDSSHV